MHKQKVQIILFLVLISSTLTASRARGAELAASSSFTLNIDVYSGLLPHDYIREEGFKLELNRMQQGWPVSKIFEEFYPRVIHLQHRAEKEFLIGETGKADGEKVVAVAHVTPQPGGKLNIEFSELGRPPAYNGSTQLTVGKGETRVLQLPAIDTDKGDGTLRTVVVISTKVPQQGD